MHNSQTIGVGIIGTGKHGSRYASHIVNDLTHCFHLAAISRRSPAATEQAATWNTRLHNDWRELVELSFGGCGYLCHYP